MSTVTVQVVLVPIACYRCAVYFGVPEAMLSSLKRTGNNFWCPSGHQQHFTETDADRLRKQLARTEQERDYARANATHYRDQREAEERAHRATRGHVTRLRKRVAAGVCPCCRRSFADLARHMAGQHPDFAQGGAS